MRTLAHSAPFELLIDFVWRSISFESSELRLLLVCLVFDFTFFNNRPVFKEVLFIPGIDGTALLILHNLPQNMCELKVLTLEEDLRFLAG